jgi:hypothetical protein
MQRRVIEKPAAAPGGAVILALAVLTAGCVEPAPPEPDFAVLGSATGVLVPVTLELGQGSDAEQLTVTQDGTFAFASRLEDGASYTVSFVDASVPCTLRNQAGVIAGEDTAIELTCTGASLTSVVVSGVAPTVTLVPGTTDYVVDIPLSQAAVTLTATVATPGDTLTIAGAPVASGAPSDEIALLLGDNPVDIVVENGPGWRRAYRLTLRRAAELAQYAYGKASTSDVYDQFGWSVALSGDTLAVGADGEDRASGGGDGNQEDESARLSGAVYVFRRSGTVWQQEAYLKASNAEFGDGFGYRVTLSGDTLAVGAHDEDSASRGIDGEQADNSATDSGAVYVFRRAGTSWQQEAYLKASNTGVDDSFGEDLALSGDTLAVGAQGEDSASRGVDGDQDDDSVQDSGAVYVFRRAGTAWQQEAYLKASNTGEGEQFGATVALSGDTLAIGANFEDSGATGINGNQDDASAPRSGAVYVFRRASTSWQQEAYIKASNTGIEDFFGDSLALSGETLAVGAYGEDSVSQGVDGNQDDNTAERSGAVYVFRRSGTDWQQEAYLKASNAGADDFFGYSVALASDTLAVGAMGEDSTAAGVNGDQGDNSAERSGAVYVFRRSGATWRQEFYLKASNTGVDDHFGQSVALSDDTLVAGAYYESSASGGINGDQADDSAAASGAVYVFH